MVESQTTTTRNFMDMVQKRFANGLAISVGLDATSRALLPDQYDLNETGIVDFHREVILATRDQAAVYKPQIAGFETLGPVGLAALEDTVNAIKELAPEVPIIVDAKRGDIANTNEQYASAIFDRIGADALTVAPYMGPETMTPFLERKDKGVIVLCRTSNPGANHYQSLQVDGMALYQYVARDVATNWNANGNCCVVVGATAPAELGEVRKLIGDMPILVPGIGAQGGSITEVLSVGCDSKGAGLMLHASRTILGAARKDASVSPCEAIAAAMKALTDEIAAARPSHDTAS